MYTRIVRGAFISRASEREFTLLFQRLEGSVVVNRAAVDLEGLDQGVSLVVGEQRYRDSQLATGCRGNVRRGLN